MSRFQFQQIDGRNITYKRAFDIARVRVNALAEDIVQREIIAEQFRIDAESFPPIAEYEKLQAKLRMLNARVKLSANHIYLNCMSDPRVLSFVLADTASNDRIVAISEWDMPTYADPLFEISVLRRIYIWYLRLWNRVADYFNPTKGAIEPIIAEYTEASELQGTHVEDVDQRVEELKALSFSQLEKEMYPDKLSYYLKIFGVRTDYQGLGLGKELFVSAITKMQEEAKRPPMIDGPAKLQWTSTPIAQSFYRKLNCLEGKSVTTKRGFEHVPFFLNVE